MPARCQRSRFCLTIADDAGNDQIWVVEGCSIGMRNSIAELSALMDGPGRLRCYVAGDATWKRKLFKQPLHPDFVGSNVWINFAVGSLEIGVRDQTRPAMSRSGDIDHVEVVLFDHSVQVNVDEVQAGRGTPVAQKSRLDVVLC